MTLARARSHPFLTIYSPSYCFIFPRNRPFGLFDPLLSSATKRSNNLGSIRCQNNLICKKNILLAFESIFMTDLLVIFFQLFQCIVSFSLLDFKTLCRDCKIIIVLSFTEQIHTKSGCNSRVNRLRYNSFQDSFLINSKF